MSQKKEFFSSRLGFVLSLIGVAVGAGNIWRFSRVVAQNGGGSFLVPWVIFLFIWSIPLMIAEVAMGKLTRKAPLGAIAMTAGKRFGWMGAFIAIVATGILFYYSVVVGWGLSYFFYAVRGTLASATLQPEVLWEHYSHSFFPLIAHFVSISVGCFVVYKGIVHGIEKSNKFLIPALIFLMLVILVRALTLPNALGGLSFLFTPHWKDLLNYEIWLEALTQNAWDTGAGWGLLLVYAGYAKKTESVISNSCITACANNAVSLVMGVIIFSTVFSLEEASGIQALISGEGSTSTGLTFIYLPKLFLELPGGTAVQSGFAALFFLAFTFAALSSMISMVQLTSQVLTELGIKRERALLITGGMAFLLGVPSALNMAFFENQDWTWGLGLIVSGLFISFAVTRFGANRYRMEAINSSPHDLKLGKFYNFIITTLIPIQGILLLLWYFYSNINSGDAWWNPFGTYSLATVVLQWGLCIVIMIALNRYLVKRTLDTKAA
jgi:NSS family neurotransmitter:Na+ symporter